MSLNPNKTETLWLLAALTILILVSFFIGLGSIPLFDVDEGAFSEATREMIIRKNYLTTYLNGAPRFDKPILIYWLQLICVKLFGVNEFAFRLPSALAGSAWAAAIFLFVRKHTGNRQAFMAAALMVFSFQVIMISKAAISDALLNCFLALTMFALLQHITTGSKKSLLLAFAAAGFGMLTKGPIAILIPVAVSFLFCLQERTLKKWIQTLFNPFGILLFLSIALPWYILEYKDQGMAFIEGFFFKHNLNRFYSSFEGHSGSLLYYVPVMIIGMMPFTGLLFTVFFNLKKLLSERTNRFLFIWFCFVFVFFSLSGTKLPHYVIYGYTPLFILMARALPLSRHPERFILWPLILLTIFASVPLLLPMAIQKVEDVYIKAVLTGSYGLFDQQHILIIIASGITLCIIQILPKFSTSGKMIASGLVLSFLINMHLMPLVGKLLQEPVKEAAFMAKKEGYKIVMWDVYYPSFFLYSESFAEERAPKRGEIVLTTVAQLNTLHNPAVLYSKYGVVLAKLTR
ncbi:MAG: glycosyltransferase family 39 protein [Chlorobiaceae bacterium]